MVLSNKATCIGMYARNNPIPNNSIHQAYDPHANLLPPPENFNQMQANIAARNNRNYDFLRCDNVINSNPSIHSTENYNEIRE